MIWQKLKLVAVLLLAGTSGCTGQAIADQPSPSSLPSIMSGDSSGDSSTVAPRITITLTLSSPADLRVKEGDTVVAGQVLGDRTRERRRLEAQKSRLELQKQRLSIPIAPPDPVRMMPEVAGLPPASFLSEVAGVEQAKVQLEAAERRVQQQRRMLDLLESMPNGELPAATIPHEEEVLAQLQQQVDQANAALQYAQGKLAEAQTQRQFDEYQHSLEMSKRAIALQQAEIQRQEQLQRQDQQEQERAYQLAQLDVQQQVLETQIAQLSAVRSPYNGTILRVKFERQNDQNLIVELTLVANRPLSSTPSSGATSDPSPHPVGSGQ
jgi:hypothetical protein